MEITNNLKHAKDILKLFIYRFLCIYILFFIIFNISIYFPLQFFIKYYFQIPLSKILPFEFIGLYFLNTKVEIDLINNGSGDTTFHYAQLITFTILSIILAIIWCILNQNKSQSNSLYYLLTTLSRYFLAFQLFDYGVAKIFNLQFSPFDLVKITKTFGESSPMGLAWAFFGYSKWYKIFIGVLEISSILLLFRKTITIGAIISFIITLQIMAINYFYDIPLKILSTTLFLLSLSLLSNNLNSIFRFLIYKKNQSLKIISYVTYENKFLNKFKSILKFLIISYTMTNSVLSQWKIKNSIDNLQYNHPLYGVYTVTRYITGLDTILDNNYKVLKWNQVIFDNNEIATIKFNNDSIAKYYTKIDTINNSIELYQEPEKMEYFFNYNIIESDSLYFNGTIKVLFVKNKISNELMSRGFHWINEYPYNK